MPVNYRVTKAKILWGAGFATTLSIGYLLDNVKAGPQPRAGGSTVQGPSGIEDAWTVGTDYLLAFEMRWIPQQDTATPLATGWDGATGVAEWLRWARDKNPFRFFPDITDTGFWLSYLVDPMSGYGEPEEDGTRRLACVIRNSTTRMDGY